MMIRWGLGPVFAFEWLTSSRRWQLYAMRSLFVGALLGSISFIWWTKLADQFFPTFQSLARVGESFYYAIVGTQLVLVLLAAPAATAGAICLDKSRGTLDHLLATDLSNAEIVLGKLAARLVPVIGAIFCALPVMALATLLGGVDPVALSGAFLVTLCVAILACTLALTLSVWGRQTFEVLMATYLVLTIWLLAVPIATLAAWTVLQFPWANVRSVLELSNPIYLAFAPYTQPGAVGLSTYGWFFGVSLLLSAVLAGLAVHRIRSVALRQAGRGVRPARRRATLTLPQLPALPGWPVPSLDDNPVLWREWHRKRPSRWSCVVWGVYGVVAALSTVLALFHWIRSPGGPGSETPAIVSAFVGSAGLLFLSISSATSLAEERVRGSLDVLLATPMSTRTILWGKWYGTFRSVPRLAILPMLAAVCLATRSGYWIYVPLFLALILAYGAAITSLGLAMATWFPRLGRAIGCTVGIYVVFSVGWIFAIVSLFPHAEGPGPGLAIGSPFFGFAFGTACIADPQHAPTGIRDSFGFWLISWTSIFAVVARGLFSRTVRTFDRCLGRASEHGMPPESHPSARKSSSAVQLSLD